MGGSWDTPNTKSEPAKSKWLDKGNLEEMPQISDLNDWKGVTLSWSPSLFLSTCTLFFFPPNKYFTCFTTFHLCGKSFWQSRRTRPLSLIFGLVARIRCSHHHDQTSVSGGDLKPCRGYPRSFIITNNWLKRRQVAHNLEFTLVSRSQHIIVWINVFKSLPKIVWVLWKSFIKYCVRGSEHSFIKYRTEML